MANFGMVGVEWQERVNWDRMRKFRRNRARHMRKEYGRGSLVRAMSGAAKGSERLVSPATDRWAG